MNQMGAMVDRPMEGVSTPEGAPRSDEALARLIDRRVEEALERRFAERQARKTPRLAIIATKGTLDMAYPPFILASTASALGWEVDVFFTFYGLELLKKDLNLQVSPLGNPAMPMKMPFGPGWFRAIDWKIPNAVVAGVPGFERLATGLMHQTLGAKGVAPIAELREACVEGGTRLFACQMTVDLFGYHRNQFIDEVADWIGAASYLPLSAQADVSLFI